VPAGKANSWNDFQKATKTEFSTSKEAAGVWNAWDRGTFPTKTTSILYHFAKHGKGRTLAQYTADAQAFWSINGGSAVWGTHNPGWAPSYKLKLPPRGGYFTASGAILTYWD
jgi:hypothetical protein